MWYWHVCKTGWLTHSRAVLVPLRQQQPVHSCRCEETPFTLHEHTPLRQQQPAQPRQRRWLAYEKRKTWARNTAAARMARVRFEPLRATSRLHSCAVYATADCSVPHPLPTARPSLPGLRVTPLTHSFSTAATATAAKGSYSRLLSAPLGSSRLISANLG